MNAGIFRQSGGEEAANLSLICHAIGAYPTAGGSPIPSMCNFG
jgi:hypothetical protein